MRVSASGPVFGNQLGVEFDLDGLLRMDTATKVKAAADALKSGALAPNEAALVTSTCRHHEAAKVRICKSRTTRWPLLLGVTPTRRR